MRKHCLLSISSIYVLPTLVSGTHFPISKYMGKNIFTEWYNSARISIGTPGIAKIDEYPERTKLRIAYDPPGLVSGNHVGFFLLQKFINEIYIYDTKNLHKKFDPPFRVFFFFRKFIHFTDARRPLQTDRRTLVQNCYRRMRSAQWHNLVQKGWTWWIQNCQERMLCAKDLGPNLFRKAGGTNRPFRC